MVNYKIVNYTANIDTPQMQKADVFEVKTNQVIRSQIPVGEAKEVCRHLNFGGGFDGETPTFFLSDIKKSNGSNQYLV